MEASDAMTFYGFVAAGTCRRVNITRFYVVGTVRTSFSVVFLSFSDDD